MRRTSESGEKEGVESANEIDWGKTARRQCIILCGLFCGGCGSVVLSDDSATVIASLTAMYCR